MSADADGPVLEQADSIATSISAAHAGSAEALGRLWEECRQYLMLVAGQELRDDLRGKLGASDLVQDTFIEAQRDFDRFDGVTEAELLAWLRQILLNNLHDADRRFAGVAKRNVGREISLDADSAGGHVRETLRSTDESPSWPVHAGEQNAELAQALARLPNEYRQVIVLRNLDLKPFAEIGALMQRSAEAARKLWVRAIAALSDEILHTGPNDGGSA